MNLPQWNSPLPKPFVVCLALKLVLLTSFFLSCLKVRCQNFKFEPVSSELGLSQNFISDIEIDSSGFVWVATPSGLNRFDGYSFKTFKNDPLDSLSLAGSKITAIELDHKGRLWVAHEAGVQFFDLDTGELNPLLFQLHFTPKFLLIDSDGVIWAIDSKRQVHRFQERDDGSFQRDIYADYIPNFPNKEDVVRDVEIDSQQRIWVNAGSFLGMLDFSLPEPQFKFVNWQRFKQRSKTNLKTCLTDSLVRQDKLVQSLVLGKSGDIYVFDGGVLSQIQGNQVLSTEFRSLENSSQVNLHPKRYRGHVDQDNLLWLHSSVAHTHLAINLNTMRVLPKNNQVFENIKVGITRIRKASNGVLWAGTNGNGIFKAIPSKEVFDSPPASSKLSTTSIYPIYKDEEGHVWFFTQREIRVLHKDSTKARSVEYPVQHYKSKRSDKEEMDFSAKFIKGDNSGGIWIGNYNGLHHLEKEGTKILEHKYYPLKQNSRNEEDDYLLGAHDLYIDDKDSIWITTAGEFGQFHRETGEFDGLPFQTNFKTLDDNRITNRIVQTSANTLWIGTIEGLVQYQADTRSYNYVSHDPKDLGSLASNSIKTVQLDPKDSTVIWLGYGGSGMDRFDTETREVQHFNSKNGMPNETVYGILSNGQKELWISTNKGLCSFCLEDSTFYSYTFSDGLQDNEYNSRSSYKSQDNEFFFGGIHGFNRFYPDQLYNSNYQPKTSIVQVKINNESINQITHPEVLKSAIERSEHIFITPDVKMVSFLVSGMDLSLPEKINYQYQLENFDDSWNTMGTDRNITFTNLPYGDFKLKVRSTNRTGNWSHKIRELNIHVLTPWWQSWWAYLIYALTITLVILTIYRFQLNRENDKREANRLLELDTLKSRLFTNITHEFRTPITVILGMSGMIEGQEEYTRTIKKNADNLLQMVNQILDLSKLESNKLEVHYINGNLVDYLHYLTESLRLSAEQQHKELVFTSSTESVIMDYDEVKTKHIMYNLLSNALKFTASGARIEVRVMKESDQWLSVEVEDTGIGISEEKLPHIFNRFYQADASSTRHAQGTGIGLALCFELVKLLGGELKVSSEINVGSTFSLNIPVKNENAPSEYTPIPKVENLAKIQQIDQEFKESSKEKPLLLIIEDNYEIFRFIEMLLDGTYTIVHAENGQRGIEEAITRVPDIIISDVMMPYKNGFEVTETLKNDIRTSHIPIILLTAKSTQADKNMGLEKGADAYLNKPFDKAELQIRLKKLIELRKTLISKFKGLEESADESDQLENTFLIQLKEVVIENLSDSEFRIEDLENQMELSKMQLYRKLKALTGMSPTLVIRDIRLNEAMKLLQKGELNVSEVAYEVGFSDPSYFTRTFKEKFGSSPSKVK